MNSSFFFKDVNSVVTSSHVATLTPDLIDFCSVCGLILLSRSSFVAEDTPYCTAAMGGKMGEVWQRERLGRRGGRK